MQNLEDNLTALVPFDLYVETILRIGHTHTLQVVVNGYDVIIRLYIGNTGRIIGSDLDIFNFPCSRTFVS